MANSKAAREFFIKSLISTLIGLTVSSTSWGQQALMINADDYRAGQIIVVPPGNRFAVTPTIPETSWQAMRRRLFETPEESYQATLRIFAKNGFARDLDRVASIYGVTPIQMLGAIIGEHTFNTGLADYGQGVYMNMTKGWVSSFNSNGVRLQDLLREAPFMPCMQHRTSYMIWDCYQNVWQKNYRGRAGYSEKSLKFAFFNPVLAGHTFGIGQLDPIRALMVADVVAQKRGTAPINIDYPEGVYNAILTTETNVHYIAANIAAIIRTYKEVAQFDISQNIGVIGTLYNLGSERMRGQQLAAKNAKHLERGEKLEWPVENFYGWFLNSHYQHMRKWLIDNGSQLTQ